MAAEAANQLAASGLRASAAPGVPEGLRSYLTRLIGADGFTALQRRALALARAEISSLQDVKVTPDGRLEGIEELKAREEAATAITAQMLELLVALIGESLTLRLMLDAFPDISGPQIGEPEERS